MLCTDRPNEFDIMTTTKNYEGRVARTVIRGLKHGWTLTDSFELLSVMRCFPESE